MNCAEIRPLLHAYADDELDLIRSLEVEGHLESCAACAAERRTIQSLRAALRGRDLVYGAPAALRESLQRTARADGGEARSRVKAEPWFWQWLAVGATAVAALVIVLRPGTSSVHDQLLNEAVASHVRSLMVEHLTDVASSDQHTVKPWFDGKLDFAPDVKDLSARGFPLVGGRLDYLAGRPVAALVYRHGKHLVNVFVWPATGGDRPKRETENRRGYSIISYDANGLHYCLVSDLNETELSELADLLGH